MAELQPVAHNEAVHSWPTAGLLVILLASAITTCTGGVQPTQQAKQAPLLTSPAPQHGVQALGAPGCHPASPITRWQQITLPEAIQSGDPRPALSHQSVRGL